MAEHEPDPVALPRLNESQMAALERCPLTRSRRYRDGEAVFEAGDPECKFDVVKSGALELRDESDEAPHTIVTLEPGQFTGDVTHLTGSPSLVSGVARGETEVYEVSPDALRELMNRHLDLADVILLAFIARWRYLRESGRFTGLRVVGSRDSPDTFRIRTFLAKNGVPFTWLEPDGDPRAKTLLQRFHASEADTPLVVWGRKLVLKNPANRELAEALGLRRPLEPMVYDLVVIGAGPAGLAAAVYGASEGLSTVVLERTAPGGQAGRSMRIENYLGFPTGITGGELAERAFVQANKFGARIPVSTQATGLRFENGHSVLQLDGGETITARCLLIASGADYRRLSAEGCPRFEGRGVYYAATPIEAQMCQGSEVVVVGGGNSAGQAAVYLATQVRKVFLVIRGDDLHKDMSDYLARRIEETPNIEVLLDTEVRRVSGEEHLGEVELVNTKTGRTRTVRTPALFSFIGATPRTDWLPHEIERDSKGFVRTGPSLAQSPYWNGSRPPFLLEASRPGVFAAGDVRSGSVKRVASAVGEGAMAVQFVHEYLRETTPAERPEAVVTEPQPSR